MEGAQVTFLYVRLHIYYKHVQVVIYMVYFVKT